jgi:hypothetical protein
MNAFTACKDYLNDFVFTERNEKDIPKIHGFKHKYTGEFKTRRYFYLGVNAVHYKNGKTWKDYDSTQKTLLENNKNLIKAINLLEAHLGLSKSRTTLQGTTDSEIVLKCPRFWMDKGYLISLLTLFIRCFANVDKVDVSYSKFIKNHDNKIIIPSDKYLYSNFEKILKIKNPKTTFKKVYPALDASIGTIHNGGIQNFLNTLKDLK